MPNQTGILLLHGLTGVPSEMRPVEKHLQKMGFDTESATLAGHGGTHDELLAASWKDWIASAEAALFRLSENHERVVICGLSMGASIGAILAAKHPDKVGGLMMLSPTLAYDSPEIQKKLHLRIYGFKWVRDFLHVLVATFPIIGRSIWWTETPPYGLKDERLQRQITKAIEAAQRGEDTKFGLFRTYFISLCHMNYITDTFRRIAGEISCPTLVISSLEDTLVSMGNATNTYSSLGCREKSLAMLTGCDHVLTLDLKRNFVSRLTGEFMEALTGAVDEHGRKLSDSGLMVEIHNRLNPLSNADWARLVPGSPAIEQFADILQRAGVHESQCHTLVVRWDNEPILMIPLVFLCRNLNVQMSLGARLCATFFSLFAPAKLRPLMVLFGFSENAWNASPPCGGDPARIAAAWQMVHSVTKELSKSYRASVTGFVHSEIKAISPAKTHKITADSLSSWLAENSVIEVQSMQSHSSSRPQLSPEQ